MRLPVLLSALCWCAAAMAQTTQSAETIIFQKEHGGWTITVSERVLEKHFITDFVKASTFAQMVDARQVTVRAKHRGAARVMELGARIRLEVPPDEGVAVLDALIGDNRIVLAMIDGFGIGLWQVMGEQQAFYKFDNLWEIATTVRPLTPKDVSMQLSRLSDGRVAVQVIDRRNSREHLLTNFAQVENEWKFKPSGPAFWLQPGKPPATRSGFPF